MIKGGLFFAFGGIDEDEFGGAVGEVVDVPERFVVGQPMGFEGGFVGEGADGGVEVSGGLVGGLDGLGGGNEWEQEEEE